MAKLLTDAQVMAFTQEIGMAIETGEGSVQENRSLAALHALVASYQEVRDAVATLREQHNAAWSLIDQMAEALGDFEPSHDWLVTAAEQWMEQHPQHQQEKPAGGGESSGHKQHEQSN